MPLNKFCLICKKPFITYPSDIKTGRGKFCSLKCYGIWRKGKYRGKDNPYWKEKIKRTCQTCGKVFEINLCHTKRGRGKFCSRECYTKEWISRVPGWNKGEDFEILCKKCGQIIPKQKTHWGYKGKFCNRKCANQFNVKIGKNHPNWQGGKSFEPYSPSFNQQLKDRIRVRDNFICQECGIPELECDRRLSIHHIDYDKKNCKEENLISLCVGCNAKANFNRKCWTKYYQKKLLVITLKGGKNGRK